MGTGVLGVPAKTFRKRDEDGSGMGFSNPKNSIEEGLSLLRRESRGKHHMSGFVPPNSTACPLSYALLTYY
jgi:hypothetical protein